LRVFDRRRQASCKTSAALSVCHFFGVYTLTPNSLYWGDRRYLQNIPVEMRTTAEYYFDQIPHLAAARTW
jgi:hypothetical protein